MPLPDGYAKFDLDEPGVNLTLNERPVKEAGGLNHLGIQVGSVHIDLPAVRMNDLTDAPYVRLENAVGRGISHHQRGEILAVRVGLGNDALENLPGILLDLGPAHPCSQRRTKRISSSNQSSCSRRM